MSKIGKKTIQVPSGVEIKIDDNLISIKGPKGELKRQIPNNMIIKVESDQLSVEPENINLVVKNKQLGANWGLTRALIQNMINGVVSGFEKVLEFQGVGYKAIVKGNELELGLGYSHPVHIKSYPGIEFKVEKNVIKIIGFDKELVGKVAAEIRSQREPEPYKGSGIRYQGEVIRRKAGKKAVASG